MNNARRVFPNQLQTQGGELGRLKIITGPDSGNIYAIIGNQVTLGRGAQNDVVLGDLKTSRQHLAVFHQNKKWAVKDLDSSNGIQLNGKLVQEELIKTGDIISLGETQVEFFSRDIDQKLYEAPARVGVGIIEANPVLLEAQQRRLESVLKLGGMPPQLQKQARRSKNSGLSIGNIKEIFFILTLTSVGVWFVTDGGNGNLKDPKQAEMGTGEPPRALASYLPFEAGEEAVKQSEIFFKEGFREYRERNFLRAKMQFETALQINPAHNLSKVYLENAKQSIEREVKYQLDRGTKNFVAGKLKAARGNFEAVLRLLHKNQDDPKFIEAQEQLSKLSVALGSKGAQ